jgi:hypothetical protein
MPWSGSRLLRPEASITGAQDSDQESTGANGGRTRDPAAPGKSTEVNVASTDAGSEQASRGPEQLGRGHVARGGDAARL